MKPLAVAALDVAALAGKAGAALARAVRSFPILKFACKNFISRFGSVRPDPFNSVSSAIARVFAGVYVRVTLDLVDRFGAARIPTPGRRARPFCAREHRFLDTTPEQEPPEYPGTGRS